ncbi:carboxylate/amino acid/amine transporter [Pasteurella canis]|uniref:Carboxylate/amino acid/amine transporter n=1 Tax=Pasteurella canis TaxID=753 RepID=A0A379ETK2_9PAST|nr:DMT family transporter [Pasteurella canis]SUC09735.1 carboxylate/amino acid/amine transporter [Pasteurella canis]
MRQYAGYFWGILSGLLWGIAGILYELLSSYYPLTNSLTIILFLLLIIEFSAFMFCAVSHYKLNLFKQFELKNKSVYLGILAGMIGGPIGMLCYLQAIQYIGVGYAAPISSIYPVFGTIFAFLFLKDAITKLGIIGLCLAIGCTILLGLDISNSQFSVLGIVLAITCAISWGGEIVISSYVMQSIKSSSAYFLRQLGSSFGYIILVLYLDVEFFNSIEFFKDTRFLTIIIFIILSSMASYFLYYRAIYLIKPIRAMMLNITYGFWIILIGFLLNGKHIDIMTMLLVIGVVLGAGLTLKDKRENI